MKDKGDYMIIEIKDEAQLREYTKDCRVLIDVWATWCGPCKQMNPVLYDLDADFKQAEKEFKILKIDTDNSYLDKFLNAYNITAVPTFLIYENEKIIDKHIGAIPKNKFKEFLLQYFY
jgi:thioredoxin 1